MSGAAQTTPPRIPVQVVAVVAAGGALGAAARYGLALLWPTTPAGLPWSTLVTNLVGCALLGALMQAISTRIAPHPLLRPFLGTGVLGGFTTFSTYALETTRLLTAGSPGLAIGYVVATVAGALAAVWLGMRAASATVRMLRRW